MARIKFSSSGNTPFQRLLGYDRDVQTCWIDLESAFYRSSTFDAELLEQVRRTLAYGNACDYCMNVAGPAAHEHGAERTSLAVAFASLMVDDHTDITDAQFDVLRSEFTDSEIAQLTAYIAFTMASQIVGATLSLKHADREMSLA